MCSVEGLSISEKENSSIRFNIELNGENIGSITNIYTASGFDITIKLINDYS